jgi:pseudouridine synthase
MCGVAARRKADDLIAARRVRVNGTVVPPGGRLVMPGRDLVEVDGTAIAPDTARRYFAVNKPRGYLSAVSDRSRRPLVTSLVHGERESGLHPVGRLDLDSRGLMLLTNDGELSFRLQHPRHHVEKEYALVVRGAPSESRLDRIRAGIPLEQGRTAPAEVEVLGPGAAARTTRVSVVLRQGWKRQLRASFRLIGHEVLDLCRVRIGPLAIGELREGGARPLAAAEVEALRASVGLPAHGATNLGGKRGA